MARSRASATLDTADTEQAAEDHYRRLLAQPATVPWGGSKWQPVTTGPTWQRKDGFWLLPEKTLGWKVLGWSSTWLQLGEDEPWEFTPEQARFVLWWYAIDDAGRFLFRDGVLQRLKGWGKDPLGAVLLAVELLGPCRFGGWASSTEPIVVDEPKAWVQTAAVSLEQTKNTMRLFPSLFSEWTEKHFRLTVLKRTIHALGEKRHLEAVTSAPKSLEGNRATCLLLNETHLWDSSNEGHEMDAVIRRNRAKSPQGSARTLRITNAYDPNDDSVAQKDREAWEKAEAGGSLTTRLLYDSLEAPPEAPLTADEAPEVVKAIRGDAVWLHPPTMVEEILDTRNPPSQSRRFWYNQIWAHEESWTTPVEWDRLADKAKTLEPGDTGVMFFDGSKSDDATGLVFVRIPDGHVFVLGCWQRPQHAKEWSVPRDTVDAIVDRAFELYDVRGFFADPGAGEDESGERYWDARIDRWGNEYGKLLNVWATQTGDKRHAVMWDMSSPARQAEFTQACERTLGDIAAKNLSHDGNPTLRDHVRNCRRRPNKWGVAVGKEHRESSRKIDLAVCTIGARMVLRKWEALPDNKKRSRKRSGIAEFF